jgi:ribosome-binding protein aMBF1 (putative translation factor)
LLFHSALVFDDGLVTKPIGADVKRKSKTPNEVFGRAVTEMRTARQLSQSALAASLGYSTYYLGRIERGLANTSCDVMAAVSNYFDMSIGQFWTYAEKLSKNQNRKK